MGIATGYEHFIASGIVKKVFVKDIAMGCVSFKSKGVAECILAKGPAMGCINFFVKGIVLNVATGVSEGSLRHGPWDRSCHGLRQRFDSVVEGERYVQLAKGLFFAMGLAKGFAMDSILDCVMGYLLFIRIPGSHCDSALKEQDKGSGPLVEYVQFLVKGVTKDFAMGTARGYEKSVRILGCQ